MLYTLISGHVVNSPPFISLPIEINKHTNHGEKYFTNLHSSILLTLTTPILPNQQVIIAQQFFSCPVRVLKNKGRKWGLLQVGFHSLTQRGGGVSGRGPLRAFKTICKESMASS